MINATHRSPTAQGDTFSTNRFFTSNHTPMGTESSFFEFDYSGANNPSPSGPQEQQQQQQGSPTTNDQFQDALDMGIMRPSSSNAATFAVDQQGPSLLKEEGSEQSPYVFSFNENTSYPSEQQITRDQHYMFQSMHPSNMAAASRRLSSPAIFNHSYASSSNPPALPLSHPLRQPQSEHQHSRQLSDPQNEYFGADQKPSYAYNESEFTSTNPWTGNNTTRNTIFAHPLSSRPSHHVELPTNHASIVDMRRMSTPVIGQNTPTAAFSFATPAQSNRSNLVDIPEEINIFRPRQHSMVDWRGYAGPNNTDRVFRDQKFTDTLDSARGMLTLSQMTGSQDQPRTAPQSNQSMHWRFPDPPSQPQQQANPSDIELDSNVFYKRRKNSVPSAFAGGNISVSLPSPPPTTGSSQLDPVAHRHQQHPQQHVPGSLSLSDSSVASIEREAGTLSSSLNLDPALGGGSHQVDQSNQSQSLSHDSVSYQDSRKREREESPRHFQRKYVCTICPKSFSRPSSLRTHMYSHTGEKRKFLQIHLASADIQAFVCPVDGCHRQFSVVSNLRRHQRVHGGI